MTVAERSKEVKLHLWWPLVAISYNIVSVKGREFISPPHQSQGDGMWDAGGLLLSFIEGDSGLGIEESDSFNQILPKLLSLG